MAEVKTSTVQVLDHWNKQDAKFGNWKHTVTMENGDKGYVQTKDPEGKAWEVGKQVTYDLNKHEKKNGEGFFYTLKIHRDDQSKGGASQANYSAHSKQPSLLEYKANVVTEAYAAALKAAGLSGKEVDSEKVMVVYRSILAEFHSQYERIFNAE